MEGRHRDGIAGTEAAEGQIKSVEARDFSAAEFDDSMAPDCCVIKPPTAYAVGFAPATRILRAFGCARGPGCTGATPATLRSNR